MHSSTQDNNWIWNLELKWDRAITWPSRGRHRSALGTPSAEDDAEVRRGHRRPPAEEARMSQHINLRPVAGDATTQ
jgi:hypothetical protein